MPIFANVIQDAFSPLISLFESVLVFIHDNVVGGSWGFAIVGLTVLVRAIMVPLTLSQLRSMQKMRVLAPQLKALQEKYKDDKQRQQEEVMKFYREQGVNPFASCLPLVLQLPVFVSLFYMLRTDLKLDICGKAIHQRYGMHVSNATLQKLSCNQVDPHSAKFLFIPDITHQATGAVLVVLLILYVGSQLASTMLMSVTVDANQRRLMMLLPLVFTAFIFRFPAGLLVYWITTNAWTMGQQYFVKSQAGPPPASADTVVGPERSSEPVLAAAGGGSVPPPPPRKKKKRSGRRR
jgi:YidC/Oxa1 family membrane protein insertase